MSETRFTLDWFGDRARGEIIAHFEQNLAATALHLQKEVTLELTQAGGGREYTVPGTNATYRASAPGAPPAVQTGHLSRSVMLEKEDQLKIHVGVKGVPYAKRLEFGFAGRDSLGRVYNQAKRPFFVSTYNRELEKLKELMRRG